MEEFKLIAIRPLKGCSPNILKSLKEGEIYQFYNDFTFKRENESDINSEIKTIIPPEDSIDLYSSDKLKINISAVVGENGSGKSTLMDIFYLMCYAISMEEGLIKESSEYVKRQLEQSTLDYLDYMFGLKAYENLFAELFFYLDSEIIKIEFKKGKPTLYRNAINKDTEIDLRKFFYTICLNYSLYGLNEKYNIWLKPLFHKNDGYQTPIVLNPYRVDGNIDVNSELHLANSRTLLNLCASSNLNPEIIEGKYVKSVRFSIDIVKNDLIPIGGINISFKRVYEALKKEGYDVFDVFDLISIKLANFKLGYKEIFDKDEMLHLYLTEDIGLKVKHKHFYSSAGNTNVGYGQIKYELIKYVIVKFFKMIFAHPERYSLKVDIQDSKKLEHNLKEIITSLKTLINQVSGDRTHNTLKIRQAVYSIKYSYFKTGEWRKVRNRNDYRHIEYTTSIPWVTVKKFLSKVIFTDDIIEEYKLEKVPAALVKPNLLLKEKKIEIPFYYDSLSSGEQQLINILQTITYHIDNIISIHYSKKSSHWRYRYINLFFDEIELYFHPEYQRLFISKLVYMLNNHYRSGIEGINILFSTHSPFILSDIPSCNILRLKKGKPYNKEINKETFGANIHDLLANDFFLSNGFMGEFAKEKIKKIIDLMNSIKESEEKSEKLDKLRKQCENVISIVGEPILKHSLQELFTQTFKHKANDFIDAEIERLNKLREKE